MLNSIVYGNIAARQGANHYQMYLPNDRWDYCCTVSATSIHSFAADPLFLAPEQGNDWLRGNSPCVNAGANET